MNLDLNKLNLKERKIAFCLSILPELCFSIPELMEMFQINEDEQFAFFDTIHDLSNKGFLQRNKALYGIKPEFAHYLVDNKITTVENCSALINYFTSKLENSKLDLEKEFEPLFAKMKNIFTNISGTSLKLAQLSYLLSSNLFKYKKYQDALKYNQLAVDISEKIDKKHPSIAIFYRNKAIIHKKLGDNNLSIYYSLKDIEILELNAGKYDDLLPSSYYSLSKTYEDAHDYEKAIEFGLKAIHFEKKRKTVKSLNLSGLYHNLAYYYMKLNNLDNASKFIDKAVESYLSVKKGDSEQYNQLLRDQRRFKALYRLQKFLLKFKIPIIILIGILVLALVWSITDLFLF